MELHELEFQKKILEFEQQTAILRDGLNFRQQVVVNIGISSIALIILASLSKLSLSFLIGVISLLLLNLVTLWFQINEGRRVVVKGMEKIVQLADIKDEVEEMISKEPFYKKYFPEIVGSVFSIIICYFIVLLLCNFFSENYSHKIQNSTFNIKSTESIYEFDRDNRWHYVRY